MQKKEQEIQFEVLRQNMTAMSNRQRQSQGQQLVSGIPFPFKQMYLSVLFIFHSVSSFSLVTLWRPFWSWPRSAQTLSLDPFRLEDKIMALQWACCAENRGPEPMFPEPHIAAPHHCLFIPLHPTWQKERETQTSRERERLLAVNPGLAGFSWTAVSNKVSRLKKKRKKKKGKNGVLHNNPVQRERQQRRKRGMNDGETVLKSLNDRGQFLLTRRKRYNESTDCGYSGLKADWLARRGSSCACLDRYVRSPSILHEACVGTSGFGGKKWKKNAAASRKSCGKLKCRQTCCTDAVCLWRSQILSMQRSTKTHACKQAHTPNHYTYAGK